MALISRYGNRQFGNFNEQDLYSGCSDAPDEHYLSDALIDALNFLWKYYGTAIEISARGGYRTQSCNAAAGGAEKSQHLLGRAVDVNWKENETAIIAHLNNDIRNEGIVFQSLLDLGIRGFGLYNTFIHIDARVSEGKQNYNGIKYAFFDQSTWINSIDPPVFDGNVQDQIDKVDSNIFDKIKGFPKAVVNFIKQIFNTNVEDGFINYGGIIGFVSRLLAIILMILFLVLLI